MIDRYTTQEKIHMKIFMSDVSVYNTHPDFRPYFRRKKSVLYAENYGTYNERFSLPLATFTVFSVGL